MFFLGGGMQHHRGSFSAAALRRPETYALTAKRRMLPWTRMGMELDHEMLGEGERVRVGVGVGERLRLRLRLRGLLKRDI